jgi:hypothetical protein
MKHTCDICNYETSVSSNYKKHLLSGKHIMLSSSNDIVSTTKKDINIYKCQYCIKTFKDRSNRSKHSRKCIIEYTKIQQQCDEVRKIEREKAKKQKHKQQKLLQEMIINIVKHTGTTNNTTKIINNNNSNNNNSNNCVNFNYIKKNFTNPLTLEECLAPALTDVEKENIVKTSPIVGCEYIIMNRCIDNIELAQRPIHNIDNARNRFAVYCGVEPNKSWVTKDGKYIISKFIPFVVSEYTEKLKTANGDQSLLIAKELYDLQTKGKKKLEKSIGDLTYIKNTITVKKMDKHKCNNNNDNDSDRDIDSDELNEIHDKLIKRRSDKNDMLNSIIEILNSATNNTDSDDDYYNDDDNKAI